MNRSDFKDIWFMVKISAVCSLILLSARALVGEKAELGLRTADAAMYILNVKLLPTEESALQSFSNNFEKVRVGNIKLWRHKTRKELWACEASSPGMWGKITGVLVADAKNHKLKGLKIIHQNETAGLGARIESTDFSGKFTDLNISNGIKMVPIKVADNEYDGISGATVSSGSAAALVNKAVMAIKAELKAKGENW